MSFLLLGRLALGQIPEAEVSSPPGLAPAPTSALSRQIAFVFEDGPSPYVTPLLLDALKKHGMKATFAVSGQNLESNPGLARRIVSEGHEIANHTYSLPNLKKLSPADIAREIRAADEAIVRVAGVKPRYFRATNGELDESLRGLVQKEGYEVLDSTLDSGDWRNPSQAKLLRVILDGVKPGSVILAHESFQKSAKQMPVVFDALVKRGYVLCTASELRPPGSPAQAQPAPPAEPPSQADSPLQAEPLPPVEFLPQTQPTPQVEFLPLVQPAPQAVTPP